MSIYAYCISVINLVDGFISYVLFFRLVNGVVEKTRKKELVSIAVAADAIGIPRMLIDVRHGKHVLFSSCLFISLFIFCNNRMEWKMVFIVLC